MPVARILSLDGGGIRGIITAVFLSNIEENLSKLIGTQTPLASRFHMIAGASIGGILALGMARPEAPMKACELLSILETRGDQIFSRSIWRTINTLCGFIDVKYSAKGLESILTEIFGEYMLSDVAAPHLLLTAYDIEKRDPHIFKSWRSMEGNRDKSYRKIKTHEDYDFYLKDAARATSAAPTYFEPALINNRKGNAHSLVDGGVFANNPAMCAYAAAKRLYKKADEIMIVSIGTGQLQEKYPHRRAKRWGILNWALPLLSVMLDGESDAVDYQLNELMKGTRYFRLQVDLAGDMNKSIGANEKLDGVCPDNIAALRKLAEASIEREPKAIDDIVKALAEPREDISSLL